MLNGVVSDCVKNEYCNIHCNLGNSLLFLLLHDIM